VQKTGADAGRVEAKLGDDARNACGVNEVRIAGFALLPLVRTLAVVVRPAYELGVGCRLVRLHALDDGFDREHAGRQFCLVSKA
jgi:hypothetical protein